MYWEQPERMFGADLGPVVLKALWRAGRAMTGRQVARVAGGSARGVLYVLDRLAQQGLVTRTTVGGATLNELNRDHLMFPALDAAFRLATPWETFAERVRALTAEWFPDTPPTVAVFGSVARREAEIDSDVDLLVVVDRLDDHAEDFRAHLSGLVRAWTGQPAGIYLTTFELLAEAVAADDPVIESFRADAITIVGADVRTYLEGER